MQTTDTGTNLEGDDRPAIRFERVYPHPLERVWEAISDRHRWATGSPPPR